MKKTTDAQLRAIKKWRANNKEKYNEKSRETSLKYYHNNKDKILEKKKEYYLKKKLAKEILNENEVSAKIIEEMENSIIN
jgi:hypothetical protein